MSSLRHRLRLNAERSHSNRRSVSRSDDIESAVLEHLGQILCVRRGAAPSAPAFGLDDLNDLSQDRTAAAATVQRSLKETIIEHEPRLQSVQVRVVTPGEDQDPSRLYIEIRAQLDDGSGNRQPFQLELSVDDSGSELAER